MKKTRVMRIAQWATILLAAAVLLLGVVGAALFYAGYTENGIARLVVRIVPLPAAMVNWQVVSVADVERSMAATRRFYQQSGTAPQDDLWGRSVVDKLVEDAAVRVLAKRAGIVVTDAQAHARVMQELDRNGKGRVAQRTIREIWGFSLADFERYVVKPALYREALEHAMKRNVDIAKLRSRIHDAGAALDKGEEFSAVAQSYSTEAEVDAGWFAPKDLMPEIAAATAQLKVGEHSDIIETDRGFHIVRVADERMSGAERQIRLQHILVRKPSFAEWLDEQIAALRVRVFLPQYIWDATTRHVAWRDPALREAEAAAIRAANAQVQQDAASRATTRDEQSEKERQ